MYLVVIHDRHLDDQYKLFIDKEKAIEYAKKEHEELNRNEKLREENIKGYIWFAYFCCDSDYIYVQEVEDPIE